jgi:HAD superfamily hydrolase (TIGR01509 family)
MPGEYSHKGHLLFDLDGTLVDSSPAHAAAFVAALRPDHPGLAARFDYPAHQGRPTAEVFRLLGLIDPAQVVALTARKQQMYRAELAAGRVTLFPGVRALLQQLAGAGRRLYVVTGASRASTTQALAATGLDVFFADVTTADDATPGKPDPAPYRHTLIRHHLTADTCLVIEDAANGVASARAAGIDVVLVNTNLNLPGIPNLGPVAALSAVLLP